MPEGVELTWIQRRLHKLTRVYRYGALCWEGWIAAASRTGQQILFEKTPKITSIAGAPA
jgi:hypothetical protein